MSKFFYPGLRVRLVGISPWAPALDGSEATVLGRTPPEQGVDLVGYWEVSTPAHVHQDYLEPIVPDGLESIEEINALYEPSPEAVKA